ncbi:DUF6261 family protein [Capnocytophaga felis]|uniref:Uncharacterized protein n=1 Tax=Capnocytophaga felis TaxID=2267611 RepID=A0A5M4B824_9FLAO|nr:DUF6261 family protein [Capnocytophaga felis]GET45741.1 hypothetical protein RCZ01_10430 [Capnocytophaga felis]GET48010.1 hypothetical protein RCZ02_08410 [Capnocytophaga felis]
MIKINLGKLQNAEHLALMSDVLDLLTQANLQPLGALKEALAVQVAHEREAQKQIRKNQYTQELEMLDDKRDALYRGLVLRVESETYSPLEETQKAAEKVQIVVDTYGNFTKYNYQKETADIQNFVADLRSEKFLTAVQKIGLEQWVSWLEAANEAFRTKHNQRRDEYAEQPAYNLKAIRKEADELFCKVQQTASALAILQPDDTLKTFMSKLDASVTKWKEVIAQRSGNKGGKKEAE